MRGGLVSRPWTGRGGMQRRDFVMALGLAAVWPLPVQAEQPKKVPRIGCIVTGSLELPETRANLNFSFKDYVNSAMSMARTSP